MEETNVIKTYCWICGTEENENHKCTNVNCNRCPSNHNYDEEL